MSRRSLHLDTEHDQKNCKETEAAGLCNEADQGDLGGVSALSCHLLSMEATHGFTSASDAASSRSHTATSRLKEERYDVAPHEHPHNDARLDKETSFLSEMRGESRQDDVIVGDECAG